MAARNDFIPATLSFDTNRFMKVLVTGINVGLDILSELVQAMLKQEIMTNGNGTKEMRATAAQQVKEISRSVNGTVIELSIGIDESSLGGFTDQTFVRTMVVLHGNVAHGPLMTKPGQMTWVKNVDHMHLSPPTNKDGTPREPQIMPEGMMQFEKWNGFGPDRQMYSNVFDKQIQIAIRFFDSYMIGFIDSVDMSQFITVR